MLWIMRYVTVIDLDNKKDSHSLFTEMSNNNQHKFTGCHFNPMVIYTDTNYNANTEELKVIS